MSEDGERSHKLQFMLQSCLTTTSESVLKVIVLLKTPFILCQLMGGNLPQLELLCLTLVALSYVMKIQFCFGSLKLAVNY